MTVPIEIELLPAGDSHDAALMARITELTNAVYAVAEAGLWTAGATRTTTDEVVELTRDRQIAVARMNGHIVGCVRVQRLDDDTGELGMLVADPAYRGIGIGRALLLFAERASRDEGVRDMQLELLVPRDWEHPTKVFLNAWYTRLGYRVTRTGAIDEAYPALAPLLATPCDFVIYHRRLDP
jgi:GNAT superfamily N-acetyltransferase